MPSFCSRWASARFLRGYRGLRDDQQRQIMNTVTPLNFCWSERADRVSLLICASVVAQRHVRMLRLGGKCYAWEKRCYAWEVRKPLILLVCYAVTLGKAIFRGAGGGK